MGEKLNFAKRINPSALPIKGVDEIHQRKIEDPEYALEVESRIEISIGTAAR